MRWMDRMNERAELMGRMLKTIGATDHIPSYLSTGMELRAASQRCLQCSCSDECKDWLSTHDEGADKPMPSCPNADLFQSWLDDIQVQKSG
ncbi:hypothetical protein GCM10011316_33750 [Roseibium aquae]|uniref:DUF6455 domain-containing protein n=1 Tax=Roseibium aquae TaxID=1323746 RepID=A0A916TNB5_9HYPH|nr:DUF6455 family protein [Roseibium aquae]GGB58950.1 hypothetical protein GCM10011316_33750 [Roseibium aquae]